LNILIARLESNNIELSENDDPIATAFNCCNLIPNSSVPRYVKIIGLKAVVNSLEIVGMSFLNGGRREMLLLRSNNNGECRSENNNKLEN